MLSTLPRWEDVVCLKVFANLLSVESKLMHVTAWSPCACENSNTDRPVSKSQTLTTWGEKTLVKARRLRDWLREWVTWSRTCVLFWSFEWAWKAKYPHWSHRLKEILAAGSVYILRNLWGTFSAKRIFLDSFYRSGHQELSFADDKETDKLENRKKREIKTADGFPFLLPFFAIVVNRFIIYRKEN